MNRYIRRLILTCCIFLAAVPTWSAEKVAKPYKIMMILYRGTTDAEKGFMAYFERHHISAEFIVRDAQADNAKISEFVREAHEIKPDLIYTFGTTVTTRVVGVIGESDPLTHINDIPVVFDIVADPIGARLTENLKSSGRNLTGVSHLVPISAQIQALQSMRSIQRLGVIYDPQEKNSLLAVQELSKIAQKAGFSLQLEAVPLDAKLQPTTDGVVTAMRALLAKKPQFIYIPSDSFMIKNANLVVQEADAARVPVFAATEAPIRYDGALLGLVSNYFNVGELAAFKADQILSGKATAQQIPIESLNRFTYLINMGAAKQLGIYPPMSLFKVAELVNGYDSIDARE
jgi:putative ABC transport system substrate-binding protein